MMILIIILLCIGIGTAIAGGYNFLMSFEPNITNNKINSRSKLGKILFLIGNTCIIAGLALSIRFI